MKKIQRINVYDIDGVLVDSSHRYTSLPCGRIDIDAWKRDRTLFNVFRDRLLPLAHKYMRDRFNPNIVTVLATMRSDTFVDRLFIKHILGWPDHLIMQPNDAIGCDPEFKLHELTKLFDANNYWDIPRFFWEDSQDIIDSTESIFTNCFHVISNQNFVTDKREAA